MRAHALQSYDIRAELAAIGRPALLVAGAEDGAMPQTMRKLRDPIPGSRFVAIAGAGHLPCIEVPIAFDALPSDFLEDT